MDKNKLEIIVRRCIAEKTNYKKTDINGKSYCTLFLLEERLKVKCPMIEDVKEYKLEKADIEYYMAYYGCKKN